MKLTYGARTKQLLDGEMTVIRKDMPSFIPRRRRLILRAGDHVDAFNVDPQYGGKPVAIVKIKSVLWQPVNVLFENPEYARMEMQREGGVWPDLESYLDHISRMYSPHRISFELVGRYKSGAVLDCEVSENVAVLDG